MFNLKCEKLHQNLTDLIQSSELPPVVAYYILKDCLNNLNQICQEVINYQNNHPKDEETYTQTIDLLDDQTKEKIKKIQNLTIKEQKIKEEAE